MKVNKEFWYDVRVTLSYNAVFNFVIGNRGCGKSYGTLKFLVNQYKKTKKKFLYVRRYKTQIKATKNKIFDKLNSDGAFSDSHVEVKGNTIYLVTGQDREEIGMCIALSSIGNIKSTSFADYKYILFEEFLPETANERYLPDEIECVFSLYSTVDRDRDETILIALANNVTYSNPYFLQFGIIKQKDRNIYKTREGTVLAHEIVNPEYTEHMKGTRFGQITKGSKYYEYAIENQSLRDNNTFIDKKSNKAINTLVLIFQGKTYGVWFSTLEGRAWVSDKYNPNNPNVISLTLQDHSPNTMFIRTKYKPRNWQIFIENFKLGNVYYENMNIKNAMYSAFSMCSI